MTWKEAGAMRVLQVCARVWAMIADCSASVSPAQEERLNEREMPFWFSSMERLQVR
jgi:hypothetical protein